jgi:protein-tyrosine phosphatase
VQRRVDFKEVWNFRDIGGYGTLDGGMTRWRRVYRSESLHYLSANDLQLFDALGIHTIFDLRRIEEVEEFPGPRPVIHLALPSRSVFETDASALIERSDGERWLFEDYCGMLKDAATQFGVLFTRLAHSTSLPSVFHCFGGKDRTGLTAALLLSALRVERDAILDDYELTNDFRGFAQLPDVVAAFVSLGIAAPAAEGMLSAPRWAMAQALERLDLEFGGIESYLRERCGLHDQSLSQLRVELVEYRG